MGSNMKLLLTGSNGLTGKSVQSLFESKGWEVIGIDNNMRSYFFGVEEENRSLNIDIRDEKAINELCERHNFDAIIHTAAQPSHDWAKKEPLTDFDINARGTLILLEATRKYCPEAVFVHVSTDKVYGENMRSFLVGNDTRLIGEHAFDETLGLDFAGKRSLFGCSKAAADIYAQEYAHYFGLKIGIFRPGCITGKNHKGAEQHGFLSYLAKCIMEEKIYKIYGYDGKQVRDQIHADDLANAFFHFVMNPRPGEVFNIGGGSDRSVSILEAIKLIEKETDKKAIVQFHDKRNGDRPWDIHDVSKFRKMYPKWNYQYSLEDIIKDVCTK